jgi:hypothetical protein
MATIQELSSLKEKLLNKQMPEKDVNKILAYIQGAIRDESQKEKRPVTSNTVDMLYTLVFKFWNMGLLVDGINVVITGKNMAMVTFHGYKNKVLQTYPETHFDIQLVREGDEFTVAKESGAVVYQHNIGNPFVETEPPIIGAYIVFKNKRGEFIETLNKTDYEKMKDASRQKFLWGQWESEFWLKSVIKRACKRHFYDVVEEIDKYDNDNFGIRESDAPQDTPDTTEKIASVVGEINAAKSLDEATTVFKGSGLMQRKEIVAAWRAKVDEFTVTL